MPLDLDALLTSTYDALLVIDLHSDLGVLLGLNLRLLDLDVLLELDVLLDTLDLYVHV